MKTLIWLDDIRNPFEGSWLNFSPIPLNELGEIVWLKSYKEFVSWIKTNGLPDGICFDHDLADEHNQAQLTDFKLHNADVERFKEMTGYDCAKWLVNYCIDNNLKLPLFNIQSANPVGKQNIYSLLTNFNKLVN